MSMIVGHVSPDWDCLTALWLLRRFDPALENATIKLVNTGNPDAAILAEADAVVDTGRVCNYTTKRYDHHQMDDPSSTCAALLVYEHLLQLNNTFLILRHWCILFSQVIPASQKPTKAAKRAFTRYSVR